MNYCPKFYECISDSWPGIGAFEDPVSSAMGGKPWQECHCMSQKECEDRATELEMYLQD
jgi:hypothetical protein